MSNPSKPLTMATWVVRGLLGLAFGAAGMAKLAGVDMMVQTFEHIGIGQWFRYLTAVTEIGGSVLIMVPRAALFAAWMLSATMAGAILTHLFIIGGSPVPAVVLGLLSAFVAYRLRPAAGMASLLAPARA